MFLSRKEGIALNIQGIFDNPTIHRLAKVIADSSTEECRNSESQDVKNSLLPLLPAQVPYSIENHIPQVIIYLLKPKQQFDLVKLQKICKTLVNRHDALRISFERVGDQWQQKINEPVADQVVDIVDFTQQALSKDIDKQIREHYEQSLLKMDSRQDNIACRFVLYQLQDEQRFFVAIDHICSDQISLNIFWKEFHMLISDQVLPKIQQSYHGIVTSLSNLIKEWHFKDDKEHWLSMLKKIRPLKKTAELSAKETGDNNVSAIRKYFTIESSDWTKTLFQKKSSSSQLHDIILAAFLEALCAHNDLEGICLSLLYHNRRLLDSMSFTMGAFVGAFPIYIPRQSDTGQQAIDNVRSILNGSLDKGMRFSFYIDKFMRHIMSLQQSQAVTFPKITFNYLGPKEVDRQLWDEFSNEIQTKLVTTMNNTIFYENPVNVNDGRFMFFCKVDNDEGMDFTLTYDPHYFSDASINAFIDLFTEKLRVISQSFDKEHKRESANLELQTES